MNTERYLWPVIIAAGLHGALLLSFSAKNPPPPPGDVEVTRDLPPFPPIEMADPPMTDPGDAGAGRADLPPTLVDIPRPLDRTDDFTVPVTPWAPAIERVKTLPENPASPTGPGDIGTEIGSPPVPDIRSLDRVPRATVRPVPGYPEVMRKSATSGSVTVVFVVDTTGRVVAAEAERWTHREFVDPAVLAVLRWRFEPGTMNGRKVSFRMAVPIEFNAGL